MATFSIFGEIVDTDSEKQTFEDVTPAQVNAFVKKLSRNDELVLEINSPGGSVTAGLSIVNIIRKAQSEGHKTTAKVIGLAASMASVVACACEKLVVDSNSMVMVHMPWSVVQGNSNDLRKEADTLDNFANALVAIYQTKFNISRDAILDMLKAETWILGSQAREYGLQCEILESDHQLNIAACLKEKCKKYSKLFYNCPINGSDNMNEKDTNEEEKKEVTPEETVEVTESEETPETTEEPKEEEVEEEVVEEEKKEEESEEKKEEESDPETEEDLKATIEKLESRIAELEAALTEKEEEECVPKKEVDKRVSGMQAKMQLHVNDLQSQLKVRDEELAKFKAEATSLKSELDKSTIELSKVTSALVEKENALAMLSANVNKMPSKIAPKGWNDLKGKEFFDYMKNNNNILKITRK